MRNEIATIGLSMLSELPGGSTVSGVITTYLEGKASQAREIFIEELSSGATNYSALNKGDIAIMAYRVYSAAMQGAGRRNLRLMSKVIRGITEREVLKLDDFLYFSDMLATLKREEILVLATIHREAKAQECLDAGPGVKAHNAMQKTIETLVPKEFSTEERLTACMGALTRTGLIEARARGPVLSGMGQAPLYAATPLLDELVSLASLEDVLKHEP